jgi:hypothetical protein
MASISQAPFTPEMERELSPNSCLALVNGASASATP